MFPRPNAPDDFMTIPQFAAAEARRLLQDRTPPKDAQQWRTQRTAIRDGLTKCLFSGTGPRRGSR